MRMRSLTQFLIAFARLHVLTIWTAVTLFTPMALANRCVYHFELATILFDSVVFTGKQQIPEPHFSIAPNSRTFLLGNGYIGGHVYRQLSADANPRIFKMYYRAEEALLDLNRLQIIKEAFNELPQPENQIFKYTEVIELSGRLMELKNFFGITLESILKNPNVSVDVKNYLELKYAKALTHAFAALKRKFPEILNQGNGYFLPLDHHSDVKFILKPDNILVTPSGDLVIIDPH